MYCNYITNNNYLFELCVAFHFILTLLVPNHHHLHTFVLMCLQRSRCVWKIQNTPDPVERRPSEYISVAMGGSESVRGSSLAFSKQDGKCRHNP